MASITLHCLSLNFSSDIREFVNAWTGEQVRGPISLGLTNEERIAVHKLLDSYGAVLHAEVAQYYLAFPDGGFVYIDSSITDDVSAVHIKISIRPTPTFEVATFLLTLAQASNMALMASDPETTICANGSSIGNLPSTFPTPVLCSNANDIQQALLPVFAASERDLERFAKHIKEWDDSHAR